MGNRFYIAPREHNIGPTLLNAGLQLYQLKQQGELSRSQQELSKNELALRGQEFEEKKRISGIKYGTPATGDPEFPGLQQPATGGLEQRKLGLDESSQASEAKIKEADAKRKEAENVDLANFGSPKAFYTANKLVSLGVPKDHPLVETIKAMGPDPNITNAEAYNRLKNDYPAYRTQLSELIYNDYEKKTQKDPMYYKSPQGMAQMQMIDALDKDTTGETVLGNEFQGTIAAMQRRQSGAVTAEAAAIKAMRPDKTAASWQTVEDPNSNTGWSFKNLNDPTSRLVPGAPLPASAKDEARPEYLKLIDQYNSLQKGDPDKQLIMGRINKLTETSGLQVRVNKDGSIELIQGPAAGKDIVAKKTVGDLEEKMLGSKEQLSRLQAINDDFKPGYLETGNRLKASWTGIKAKLGKNVSTEDAKELTEFKKFQRKAIENINLYIKEITGAAMSKDEAGRLRLAQPDPGESWYQGDDPITFRAKLDDIMKTTRAALARYEYYKAKGLGNEEISGLINSDKAISLDEIMKRIK